MQKEGSAVMRTGAAGRPAGGVNGKRSQNWGLRGAGFEQISAETAWVRERASNTFLQNGKRGQTTWLTLNLTLATGPVHQGQ